MGLSNRTFGYGTNIGTGLDVICGKVTPPPSLHTTSHYPQSSSLVARDAVQTDIPAGFKSLGRLTSEGLQALPSLPPIIY